MSQSTDYFNSSDDEYYRGLPSVVLDPKNDKGASPEKGRKPPRPIIGPSDRVSNLSERTNKGPAAASSSRSLAAPLGRNVQNSRTEFPPSRPQQLDPSSLKHASPSSDKGKRRAPATPQRLESIWMAPSGNNSVEDSMHVDEAPALPKEVVAKQGQGLSTPQKVRVIPTSGTSASRSRSRQPFKIPKEHKDRAYDISDSDSDVTMQLASDSSSDESQDSLFEPNNPPESAATSRTTSFASVNNSKSLRKRPTERPKSPPMIRAPKIPRTPSHNSPTVCRELTASPEKAEVKRLPLPSPTKAKPSTPAKRGPASERADPDQSILERMWSTVSLPTCVIAHDKQAQRLFDDPKTRVGWGTQFTLARGVLSGDWTWQDVVSKISQLSGLDGEKMHLVPHIMLGCSQQVDNSIGLELDREQASIIENKGRGLGLRVSFDWKNQKFQLEPVEMKRSTRFARMLGSRRLLQIRVGKYSSSNAAEVKRLLSRKFVINGREFVPLPPKDDAFYLVEINGNYERSSISALGDNLRKSLGWALNWHNPIELNANQPIAKYFARIALGLSPSVPVLEFDVNSIKFIDDKVVPSDNSGKPPSEKILTDGCGLINAVAMHLVADSIGLVPVPAAIQARLGGAKGLWILDPHDKDPLPKIKIRSSQNKIQYKELDRSHRILDLLTTSRPFATPSLSEQSVMNLHANGVPSEIFKKLMQAGLEELTNLFMTWGHDSKDMLALKDTVMHISGVSAARAARIAGTLSHALGYSDRSKDSVQSNIDLGQAKTEDSASEHMITSGHCPNSGLPESWGEIAVEMLQSGFHPLDCAYLAEKIEHVLKHAIRNFIDNCQVPLPEGQAFGGYVIPDPIGVLEPGEIYYRSSTGWIDPATCRMHFNAIGEALLGRYPLCLPSDIQKVKAVDRPELSIFQDVIVVSSKPISDPNMGLISIMSILAGGDYDGNTVFVILYAPVVNSFRSQPYTINPEPLKKYFEKEVEQASQFVAQLEAMETAGAQESFLSACFLGLKDTRLGIISMFANAARDACGYNSDNHTVLTYIFNTMMDGGKTGLSLKPSAFKELSFTYTTNKATLQNSTTRAPTVLEELQVFATKQQRNCMQHYKEVAKDSPGPEHDPALLMPLQEVEEQLQQLTKKSPAMAKFKREELNQILQHVESAYHLHKQAVQQAIQSKASNEPESQAKQNRQRWNDKKQKRDVAYKFSRPLEDIFLFNKKTIMELKASYAYSLSPRFAFETAFQTLTCLKNDSMPGGTVPSTREDDQSKTTSEAAKKVSKLHCATAAAMA
ncbi:hypothetical protein Moror_14748 [Moniliophthora roreri MCA 2997]|uniref:RNA-dependent RNA polymerase n=1 Tax=Moniliophthora roreri (strain MCA 2997) TaxID=1381753 RepID=V2X6L4_MONRO|nr:hypothetical protein Moror_14748 [Moniliophthora roreri MCA 2997]